MRRMALFTLLFLFGINDAFAGLITRAGYLAVGRSNATATLLPDGRVLVAGGNADERRLEIFDPRTGVSVLTHEVTELPQLGHTATLLRDGRILLAGGGYKTDGRPIFGYYGSVSSEVYDPGTGELTPAGRMNHYRRDHTATLLEDGRVLIAGGENVSLGGFHLYRDVLNSAEIFDPATNSYQLIVSMHERRSNHTATRLRDGRVLIAGGQLGYDDLRTMEIFDPRTETFEPVVPLEHAHTNHTATLLADGRVLIVGGGNFAGSFAEIYDPVANEVEPAGDVGPAGVNAATLLPTGQVLIAGGAEAVVYDPATMNVIERFPFDASAPAAALLPDGSVLLAGGVKDLVNRDEVRRYYPTPVRPRRRAVR
ncbi:MAG: Kelch repeat-containing protein [Thermoanaerobaculia bacterium]